MPSVDRGGVFVLLPAPVSHLAARVLEAGCTPVIDGTGSTPPVVPDGAWVRIRAGRPAPGNGPVILAEYGAPVPDRPTWVESAAPRDVPRGYAGLVLKGREAGGLHGEEDGLIALTRCNEPGRVLLDAGLGPDTTAAAAALGAHGVLLVEPHLGLPELDLPAGLAGRLRHSDEEITTVVAGLRVANSPIAPVLSQLLDGEDPWALAEGIYESGDAFEHLWMAGQGLALARELADRYGSLSQLLAAYVAAWNGFQDRLRASVAGSGRPVHSAAALGAPDTAAAPGGAVGSGVLWQEARFLGRPVAGEPLKAAAATGAPVVGGDLASIRPPLPPPVDAPAEVGTPPLSAAPVLTDDGPMARPAVAIIGIGCLFPGGANSVEQFWDNILNGRSAIGEVPHDRWDPALFYDANRDAPDRTYARIGGFIEGFEFQPKRFRIPPKVAASVDPVQQITLTAVADALRDAGLQVDRRDKEGKPFDRMRCAVILGNSLGGEMGDRYAIRLAWPEVKAQLLQTPTFRNLDSSLRQSVLEELEKRYKRDLPEITEDSMPGELANVIAGRITNAFDLGGANYTVDAACASSMAAIDNATKALIAGDVDLAITGGADRSMNIATYVKFCKIGALSPDHSAPFDASANGFVMGEGAGILVLKRFEDAVRDQDRIYAVIRSVGASSDGKGKGITAPNINGQIRALERAYESAGFAPEQVDLIEAHGTSTIVGDKVEVEALSEVIGSGKRDERGAIRIGSVKSMIGHLKSAAAAASCIKTALALYHGVYPPSIGFSEAREDVPLGTIPLKVQTSPEPWDTTPDGIRRAGVSAFGFGGTNFHVVMESYGGQALPKSRPMLPPPAQAPVTHPVAPPAQRMPPAPAAARPAAEARPAPGPVASNAPTGPVAEPPEGIWVCHGSDTADLIANLERIERGERVPFQPSSPIRVAAAYDDDAEKAEQIARTLKTVRKGSNTEMLRGRGIHVEDSPVDGKLALLFTGQGSQYTDMGLDLAAAYPVVQETFDEADRILEPALGRSITSFIGVSEGEDRDEKEAILKRTEYSQPATLTLDIAILRLLASFGVHADMVAGHSLGEYGAAVAAGVMTFEEALLAVTARGREMANIHLEDPGKMAGIATRTEVVEEVLAEVPGYVVAANKNCPTQTVIAGASDAVDEAVEMFRARGITVHPLPVSHAFHSKIVAPAAEPLRGVLAKMDLKAPARPFTTNVTGDWYPETQPAIVDLLAAQIWSPVEWVAQTERMYEAGARVFVEVGPKRALAGFTVAILKRRPHRAHYTNHPKRGGVRSFRDALAGLVAAGFPIRSAPGSFDIFADPAPRLASTEAIANASEPTSPAVAPAVAEDVGQAILQIVANSTGYDTDELDLDYELEADLGIDTVKQAEVFSQIRDTFQIPEDPDFDPTNHKTLRSLIDWAGARTGATSYRQPAAPAAPAPAPAPVAPPAPAAPAGPAPTIDPDVLVRFLESATEAGLSTQGPEAFARALFPAVQSLITAAYEASQMNLSPFVRSLPEVVCTGASMGLPGGTFVFDDANLVGILRGENRIDKIGEQSKLFLEKGIVRLVKDPQTGQGSFLPVENVEQVIRLAGRRQGFDLAEWGADPGLVRALDITSQLAIAAGLEALRDAGIPLVRSFKTSASGKRVPGPWQLPEELQATTGVIFGSAFPGYDQLVEKVQTNGDDGEGRFDRRFLFQVLSMGHSQFAQMIGAKGPNTQVNAACASTTQAINIASDWIQLGRCERVIVIGADDVTSDTLLPWMGSGFMAAGAATTEGEVSKAALPFDARRHGMILGMGAVGVVLERADLPAQRGVRPLAALVATKMVNSAFHGSRLDVDHIAGEVKGLVEEAVKKEGIPAAAIAKDAFFMSHETYTPARGGSAAAEIESLRAGFGAAADHITIANTKGFTGHAMGAGIEDAVAIKALQYGVVPPLANLEEPDTSLGDLRLSKGEIRDFKYGLRLAAGFGSQLALTLWRRESQGDDRVADPRARASWLRSVTGYDGVEERLEQRTLRAFESTVDRQLPIRPEPTPADLTDADFLRTGSQAREAASAPVPPASAPAPAAAAPASESFPTRQVEVLRPVPEAGDVLEVLLGIIAEKTGYETDELEPDFELEADLGIDTVKQAEVLSEITDRYHLGQDEEFRLADHPTIEALAGYVSGRIEATGARPPVAIDEDTVVDEPMNATPAAAKPAVLKDEPKADAPKAEEPKAEAPKVTPLRTEVAEGEIQAALLEVISEKTGYDIEELELDFELEADLGIDTVKQAEVLSELRERFAVGQDDEFRLSDYPTIEALAGYLESQVGTGVQTQDAVVTDAVDAEPVVETPVETATVQTPERTPLPFSPDPEPGDVDPTLEPLPADMEALEDLYPDSASQGPKGNVPLPPSFRLRRPVLVHRRAEPVEQGLTGFAVQVLGDSELADAVRDEIRLRSGSLDGPFDTIVDLGDDALASFHVAKDLDRDRPKRWLTVTRTGGFTPRQADLAWTDGARAGFTKALGREWEDCSAKVLDVHPDVAAAEVAQLVCDELQSAFDPEVFVARGQRQIVRYKTEARPAHQGFKDAPVVLITGGARGICARIAREFAGRGPCTLVLVGRSAVPGQAFDLAAEKERIKAELKAAGERPTPANIERQLGRMRRANEAVETLEVLRAHAGVSASYVPCDLSDVVAAANLVRDTLREHGRIDICIHGAGVEESRLIQEKDVTAWKRVFDGKANGGRAMLDVLSESTFFVSMGSVAGRFGNPGQVDYAAANDAMARRCLGRPNALHVDWTAWDDVGMAAGSAMKRVLQERGVELLPADAGADLLVDMVLSGMTGEIVVAGRLGDFQTDPGHPLLDRVEMDGDIVRGYRELSMASDPWIADHAIDGVPVLPGVIGLELMAAVGSLVRPEAAYIGASDVKFDAPVKVHGEQSVLLVVEAEPRSDGHVETRLIAVRVLRTGRVRRHQHFSAVIRLGEAEGIDALPNAFLPDEVIEQPAIYSRFFHGPIFQVLDGVFGISLDGLVAEASTEPENIAADLISAPLALEAAFQAAGLHRMAIDDVMALPMAIRELRFHAAPPAGTTFSVTVREVGGAYDIDVDALNAPLLRVRGFAMVERGPLPPGDRIPEPKDPRPLAFPPVKAAPGTSSGARASADEDSAPWLRADELDVLTARGTARRQRDRIAGRIAAKRALHGLTGVDPLRIDVPSAESGEPLAQVPGWPDVAVSLSHGDGHAVAVAVRDGRVGIDRERVEARSEPFQQMWFSERERRIAPDALRQTLVWCAKEAVLKVLGTGMAIAPRHVEVHAIGTDRLTVVLAGPAHERWQQLGGGELALHWDQDGEHVVVQARMAA